jgi:4-hydroxybenzoate polyprenyltransferase
MVIVDVMVIALGFVFRAVSGAVVIGVATSPWLILCTLTLALLVGFGKRRHELFLLGNDAQGHRASLESYSLPFLDMMMGISGATAVVTYSLYTLAPETAARVGSLYLVLTVPWVMYGIFRYLYLVHQQEEGGDPTHLFVSDFPTLINAILWVVTVLLVIYYRPF